MTSAFSQGRIGVGGLFGRGVGGGGDGGWLERGKSGHKELTKAKQEKKTVYMGEGRRRGPESQEKGEGGM